MSKKLIWVSVLLWLFVCIEFAVGTPDPWEAVFFYAGGTVFFIILVEYRKRQLEETTKQR